MYKVAPLSGSFMLTSMVGFMVSAIYVFPRSLSWGFTLGIFFTIMFVASIISMTYAPIEAELAVDKRRPKKK